LFYACILADVGLATDRSPFIQFLNLQSINNVRAKYVLTEGMHAEQRVSKRVLKKVVDSKFTLHIEVFINFQALCDFKSC
jgi:hypothetical protein